MYQKALDQFKRMDQKLYQAALVLDPVVLVKSENYLDSLCREIIGQQLSGKVAKVIYKRFSDLFSGKPSVKQLLDVDQNKLREVGMAWAKVRSLKDLAEKIETKDLDLTKIDQLNNEAVVIELTKVKGVGSWTAEMFLMFALAREDIFSPGDLGLRNAVIKLYGLKEKPTKEELLVISQKWQPYRTYASLILWKYLDNFNPLI